MKFLTIALITCIITLSCMAQGSLTAKDKSLVGDLPRQFVAPTPHADNVAAWRDHILPRAEEVRFEDIPWIDSFAAGLLAADQADKPLLFWGMNGHPLGCT